jgi:hypothetical protein
VTAVPNKTAFQTAYAGQVPWNIDKRQQAYLDLADSITGSILDNGCGTGRTDTDRSDPDVKDLELSAGWPKAWFAVLRRSGTEIGSL